MKGVILAGGMGTRLLPLTKVTNKHLLPVYDQPMITYPIRTLVNAGIEEVLLVTGGNSVGEFLRLLGNGREYGLGWLSYAYQDGAGGIADALKLAREYAEGEKIIVILGDNIIEGNIRAATEAFLNEERGAKIFVKEVENPREYGVAVCEGDQVVHIDEKPEHPRSNLAVIGIYMYDEHVFEIIERLQPSARGELEITDVNNAYIDRGEMSYEVLDGWWGDSGECVDALYRVSALVAETGANKMEL
ncbi:MAG: NTP transferase domain-containing protein [Planctomycetes bacterium]|nr:NTP transferase domain-containing protein [Planctomycetota bacterium]